MRTVEEIREALKKATEQEYATLAHALAADQRKGVRMALEQARRRLDAQIAEQQRLDSLYAFEEQYARGGLVVGLDEVGRGPVAGPLTVAAVVLPRDPHIEGLNDSKQIPAATRESIAQEIRNHALAYAIEHVPPETIDRIGMAKSLRMAFTAALSTIEASGIQVEAVLLDGNPLHIDTREVNIVKGDAQSASIAAASIIAKVERDHLMEQAALEYPAYGFDRNKGYGSKEHVQAIADYGLSPLHRKTFCNNFVQERLF